MVNNFIENRLKKTKEKYYSELSAFGTYLCRCSLALLEPKDDIIRQYIRVLTRLYSQYYFLTKEFEKNVKSNNTNKKN